MLLPSTPPTPEVFTISELEAKTVTQLKAICDENSITYNTSDVKDKFIGKISEYQGTAYTEDDLTTKTLTQLQAICDGRGITYTAENTEVELKALIIADV